MLITALVLLVLAEALFFVDRFSEVKKDKHTKRFWRFTWIIAGLIAASTLAPILLSKLEEAQQIKSLKRRVVDELRQTSRFWKSGASTSIEHLPVLRSREPVCTSPVRLIS